MPTNDISDVVSLKDGSFNFSTLAAAKCVLGDLILEKQMSGKMLLIWRHVLIKEIAKNRFAANSETLKAAHAEVANLFFLEFTKEDEKQNDSEGKNSGKELSGTRLKHEFFLNSCFPFAESPKESEETKETPFQSNIQSADVTYNIRHVEEAWLHLLNAGTTESY